jgi:hypothetical protein
MSVRWRRRFLNPAAHWRQESDPDAWRRRQFNRISTHLCGAGRQNSRAGAPNILVVEDEHLIAMGLAKALQDAGSIVLGPVPTVDKAIKKIESEPHIDGAVVDVNLGGTLAYPVADLSSPGRFPSSLPQAMSTTFFGTDILNLRIAPNPICSRRWRKRWSRPCRSHDD